MAILSSDEDSNRGSDQERLHNDDKGDACPSSSVHSKWRLLHREVLPLSVEEAKKKVYVEYKFMEDFRAARKMFNSQIGEWARNPDTDCQQRTLKYSVNFGPKTANCVDVQNRSELNRTGHIFIVDSETTNEGIPFADSFTVQAHTCMRKAPPPENEAGGQWCSFHSYVNINYKKPVWGIFKGQLEKQTYSNMEGYMRDLCAALRHISGDEQPENAQRHRQHRRHSKKPVDTTMDKNDSYSYVFLIGLALLVLLHIFLYVKVSRLEELRDGILRDGMGRDGNAITPSTELPRPGLPLANLVENFRSSQSAYFSEINDVRDRLAAATHSLGQASDDVSSVMEHLNKATQN